MTKAAALGNHYRAAFRDIEGCLREYSDLGEEIMDDIMKIRHVVRNYRKHKSQEAIEI